MLNKCCSNTLFNSYFSKGGITVFSIISQGKVGKPYNYCEFLADTEEDIKDIPTAKDKKKQNYKVAIGSGVLVLQGFSSWILGNDDEYHKVSLISGGSSAEDLEDLKKKLETTDANLEKLTEEFEKYKANAVNMEEITDLEIDQITNNN